MSEQWQIDQGKRCGCRGTDEYCVCQNVRQLNEGGIPSKFTGTLEQLLNSLRELERSRGLAGAIAGAAVQELTRLRKENEILREILSQIDKVVAFESHGLGNGFAERVEEILGCQASGLQGGEAVSPAALHPGAGGEAEEIWFLSEFSDHEAILVDPNDLTEDGELKSERDIFLVDRNRIHARQDGVFVRKVVVDGEVHYRQCSPPGAGGEAEKIGQPDTEG